MAIWDDGYLAYDFGDHPFSPVRQDLTMRLARELGVLDKLEIAPAAAATEAQLLTVHDAEYLGAVRRASVEPAFTGFGLGTDDDPVFPGMYDAAALLAGGSAEAARQLMAGAAEHVVNIAGGLHHAMRGYAAGFCIFNDIVLAINTLLDGGARKVAYVDVDVHHGDGVQAAFDGDPRVMTVSLHQDPRTLFPGTGMPSECGTGAAKGTKVNVALPPGTDDAGWLRAYHAVVPAAVRAFAPDVLVTQCGCDTHHEDPLASLELTVDGQRAAIHSLHELAHQASGGRWLALGGGGYATLRCVPRTWTNLLAEAAGCPIDPATEIPAAWIDHVRGRGVGAELPDRMGELRDPRSLRYRPWAPDGQTWLDRAIGSTRNVVFPLLGLDPSDPDE